MQAAPAADAAPAMIHVLRVPDMDPQHFSAAVSILRGTEGFHVLCWSSITTAVALATVGFLTMSSDALVRVPAFQSLAFLLAQGFTVAKVSRDAVLAELNPGGMTPHGDALVLGFLKSTRAHSLQAAGFFVAAVGFATFHLAAMVAAAEIDAEYGAFYAMVLLWVTVSALCLSKCLRDRRDAELWAALPAATQAAHFDHVLHVAAGSLLYRVLVWSSALLSVGAALTFVAVLGDTLSLEGRGFFGVGVLFCISSAFHLAKLVRDRADEVKGRELQSQIPFQALVVGCFVASAACVVLVGLRLDLTPAGRLVLISAAVFAVMSAMFLAKDVRDRLEIRWLRERAASPSAPRDTR